MVIESRYWREDLAAYAKNFRPVPTPPRWSERRVVNFEKDVTISLFMVRRLFEAHKFSSTMKSHKVKISRCKFIGEPHRLRYKDIDELYRLEKEESVTKDVVFVCNQFIHADFTYAFRDRNRNWAGLYTSSDFEKKRWVYKVPISEVIKILDIAENDYPHTMRMTYDAEREDWMISTN